jgi:hypothetical protein
MKLPRIFFIAAALFFVSAGTASAAPCWKTLINDWYDGRIDKNYDPQCYRDAIKHLPPDVEVYSNAKDDLKRALQNVLANKPPNQGLGTAAARCRTRSRASDRRTPIPCRSPCSCWADLPCC